MQEAYLQGRIVQASQKAEDDNATAPLLLPTRRKREAEVDSEIYRKRVALFWYYSGLILILFWAYVGIMLALLCYYFGMFLPYVGIIWPYFGINLALFWIMFALFWCYFSLIFPPKLDTAP